MDLHVHTENKQQKSRRKIFEKTKQNKKICCCRARRDVRLRQSTKQNYFAANVFPPSSDKPSHFNCISPRNCFVFKALILSAPPPPICAIFFQFFSLFNYYFVSHNEGEKVENDLRNFFSFLLKFRGKI